MSLTKISAKLLIASLLLCLQGCKKESEAYPEAKSDKSKHVLFIQGSLYTPVLAEIKDTLTPIINNIIKKELGLSSDYNFDFFLPKDWQRLTLYYLNDTDTDNTAMNFIYSKLENILLENEGLFKLKNVKLAPQVNLFGDNKDELVIMIDDPNKELSFLNQKIKSAMNEADKEYLQKHNLCLYNISKSERFAYLPHIGLGRIRSTSIKHHIKDASQADKIYATIMQRILDETSLVVKELLRKNNLEITFKMLCIFDQQLRTCIKEYPFLL